MNWLNIFGLLIVAFLLIPDLAYAVKIKKWKYKCTNKVMNFMEETGRFGCMVLMIYNIGIKELGFASTELFLIYLIGNTALLVSYWIIWLFYYKKTAYWKKEALVVIQSCLFLLNGITMRYHLLIICAVIYGTGSIYVMSKARFSTGSMSPD